MVTRLNWLNGILSSCKFSQSYDVLKYWNTRQRPTLLRGRTKLSPWLEAVHVRGSRGCSVPELRVNVAFSRTDCFCHARLPFYKRKDFFIYLLSGPGTALLVAPCNYLVEIMMMTLPLVLTPQCSALSNKSLTVCTAPNTCVIIVLLRNVQMWNQLLSSYDSFWWRISGKPFNSYQP